MSCKNFLLRAVAGPRSCIEVDGTLVMSVMTPTGSHTVKINESRDVTPYKLVDINFLKDYAAFIFSGASTKLNNITSEEITILIIKC